MKGGHQPYRGGGKAGHVRKSMRRGRSRFHANPMDERRKAAKRAAYLRRFLRKR